MGLYDSYRENDYRARDALGSCLRSIHSGFISCDSTFNANENPIYNLDDYKTLNGFPLWVIAAPQSVRSIKLFFQEGTNDDTLCRVLFSISERFSSGYCSDLERFVIAIGGAPSEIVFQALEDLRNVIKDACRAGELDNLREIIIDHENFVTTPRNPMKYHRHCLEYITALRQCCPLLESIGSICLSHYDGFIKKTIDLDDHCSNGLDYEAPWSKLTSIDLSDLLSKIPKNLSDIGDSVNASSKTLISAFSSGAFPLLTKIKFRYQEPELDSEEPDSLLIFMTACLNYIQEGGSDFFGFNILIFEIDALILDPQNHYIQTQKWAELAEKFSSMTRLSTNININNSQLNGLFPNLEVLKCNHWLPSAQLLRIFCGNRPNLQSISPQNTLQNNLPSNNMNKLNKNVKMNTEEKSKNLIKKSGLKFEISPGSEDPNFSSFLTNLFEPELLSLKSLLIRRKRRFVHGVMINFCDQDLGYRLSKNNTSENNILQSDNLIEYYDNRADLLELGIFHDEYVRNDDMNVRESEEITATNEALFKAMKNRKLRDLEELGISEEFLRFLKCSVKKSIKERNCDQTNEVQMLFSNCDSLKILYLYLESELRCPISLISINERFHAVLVFLSSLSSRTFSPKISPEECSPSPRDSDKSNSEIIRIETVKIDFPSRLLYNSFRSKFLTLLPSLSLPSYKFNSKNDGKNVILSYDNKLNNMIKESNINESISFVLILLYGVQSCSFLWDGKVSTDTLQ